MKRRAYQIVVSGLVAVLVASVAAPGLTLHNCRQFGTRSTQLCGCCEVELEVSRGCCSQKPDPAATACHADASVQHTGASLESSCCFTSYEGPFSFDGQGIMQIGVSAPTQHELAVALPSALIVITLTVDLHLEYSILIARHSSDPPSYILTHSLRC